MVFKTKILFLSYVLSPCYLFNIVGEHLNISSSNNWALSDSQRAIIRQEGYCMNICGVGFDPEADGWSIYMDQYLKTKERGTFDDLDAELSGGVDLSDSTSEIAPILSEKGKQVRYDESLSDIKIIQSIVDVYCEYSNYSFDECMEIKRGLVSENQNSICVRTCLDELSKNPIEIPNFEDMVPIKQKFEKCLDGFRGPDEYFDYQNRTSINVKDMLRILRKNGFVVIKNFFPTELMAEVNYFLNSWDELDEWNNLTYSDFYSTEPDQLNEYENRLEIVLPFVEPFETVLSTIHESVLVELMSAYGSHQPINIDFPASIMSRPGALEQSIHSDHGYVAGMLKLNVAIHNIPESSGPTSFCPCTHQNGMIHSTYKHDCRIRYHPKLVKAGTVTIYDQSMRHNGMANNGNLKRRYILDLSYNIGNVRNNYTHSFPTLATEHIKKYRESYKNLNLQFI